MKANVCTYVSVPVPLIGTLWIVLRCTLFMFTAFLLSPGWVQQSGVYVKKKGTVPKPSVTLVFVFTSHVQCVLWGLLVTGSSWGLCVWMRVHLWTYTSWQVPSVWLTPVEVFHFQPVSDMWQMANHSTLPPWTGSICVCVCSESTLGNKCELYFKWHTLFHPVKISIGTFVFPDFNLSRRQSKASLIPQAELPQNEQFNVNSLFVQGLSVPRYISHE